MKFWKITASLAVALAVALPTIGCSSPVDDKQPKAAGGDNPNLQRATRNTGGTPAAGGAAKGGSASQQGAVNKD